MKQYTRNTLIILVFLISQLKSFAQDSSFVNWSVSVHKTAQNHYELKLSGQVKQGWHLYSTALESEGLNGVEIRYADSSIQMEQPKWFSKKIIINDPNIGKEIEVSTGNIEMIQKLQIAGDGVFPIKMHLSYFVGKADNFLPEEQKITAMPEGETVRQTTGRILIPTIDLKVPLAQCGNTDAGLVETGKKGLWSLFVLGFLGGLIALLTPCVFPMIPLTVSFFTKKAVNKRAGIRNAFMYGFFIFLIYIILSLPFHFLDSLNPEILNNISTNVYLNVLFFVIFIFFAFSFFGYYEISLPAGLQSKADSKAGVGNIAGIFFMALTLALVSFSCTGPILGSLLAGSLSGDGGAMQLTAGMGGFGLALALPFGLFALFPNWLNAIPKSGGWLNTVKVVLGFLELGLAFKFLSNADLVKHWGLLKREVFIGIWVVVSIGLSLYLFGLLKFKHDAPIKKLHPFRMSLGIVSGLFALYLIPGLTNSSWANLKLISGFPPPMYYSVYSKASDCVLGLNCSRDYEIGLAMARKANKPILIDFTGYACVNCRRMEEKVWSQPDVFKMMQEKFIIISLYVDDKKALPSAEQFTYKTADAVSREIVTVGDKWSTFETENFQNNAQPLYAIIDTDERLLNSPVGYTPSAKEYLEWLQCGLNAFGKGK